MESFYNCLNTFVNHCTLRNYFYIFLFFFYKVHKFRHSIVLKFEYKVKIRFTNGTQNFSFCSISREIDFVNAGRHNSFISLIKPEVIKKFCCINNLLGVADVFHNFEAVDLYKFNKFITF